MPRGTRSGKSIMEEVLNFFLKHRDQVVTLEQICGDLELEPDKARSNINNLRNHPSNQFDIQTLIRGRSWIYRDTPLLVTNAVDAAVSSIVDNAKPSITVPEDFPKVALIPMKGGKVNKPVSKDKIFEEIGEMKDGSVLLKDVDGKLWQATEL